MEQVRIRDAFPERFDFFHLGRIERTAPYPALQIPIAPFVVVFKVTGDEIGHCIVAFDQAPKDSDRESMSIEIANIMASKFVTQLSDLINGFVKIDPPSVFRPGERRHRSLVAVVESAVSDRYEFRTPEGRIGLRMTYLPTKGGNT